MANILLFALLGMGSGALIAGIGLGAVLQHRGSGTVDVSLGIVATTAAYIYYGLRVQGQLFVPLPFVPGIPMGGPWALAPTLLVTAMVSVLLGLLVSWGLTARLRDSTPLAKFAGSLGVLITLQAIIVLRFGTSGQSAPAVLPANTVEIFGRSVPEAQFILAGLVVVVAAVLAGVYRFSRFGLATRAAGESESTALLAGIAPSRIATINGVIAYLVAGGVGVLVAPTAGLDPTTIAYAIVPALAAALLASFTSFAWACAAGLGMGVIQSELIYAQAQSWFPKAGDQPISGVVDVAYFLIIMLVLFWRGRGLPVRGDLAEARLPRAPAPRRIAAPAIFLFVVTILGLMLFPAEYRQALINTIIGVVLCLSFVVITGYAGQISLIQMTLAGAAAFGLFRLAQDAGLTDLLAVPVAIAGALLFGIVAAIAAVRIRGVNLAIATLAAAVAIQDFWFGNSAWGDTGNNIVAPLHLLGIDLGNNARFPGWDGQVPSPVFGFVCLIVASVTGVAVALLRSAGPGQRMLAVRSNERAAAATGISVRNTKLLAFVLSAVIAGVAGCLYSFDLGSVSTDQFDIFVGLSALATAYIGGITTVAGAVFGGMFVTQSLAAVAIQNWTGYPAEDQPLIAGLGLIAVVLFVPSGLALAQAEGRAPHQVLLRGARALANRSGLAVGHNPPDGTEYSVPNRTPKSGGRLPDAHEGGDVHRESATSKLGGRPASATKVSQPGGEQ